MVYTNVPLPEISIQDSVDDSRASFITVDDCKIRVMKVKLKDTCYIMKIVDNICHLDIDLKDCESAR
jgi:hypothetical protein